MNTYTHVCMYHDAHLIVTIWVSICIYMNMCPYHGFENVYTWLCINVRPFMFTQYIHCLFVVCYTQVYVCEREGLTGHAIRKAGGRENLASHCLGWAGESPRAHWSYIISLYDYVLKTVSLLLSTYDELPGCRKWSGSQSWQHAFASHAFAKGGTPYIHDSRVFLSLQYSPISLTTCGNVCLLQVLSLFVEHKELPAKLLDYFLRNNKSNIN